MMIFLVTSVLGFGFLGILPKSINSTLKFLICPAIGLLIFTELTLLFSFILGVGTTSILLALFSEVLIAAITFKFLKPDLQLEKVPALFILSLLVIVAFSAYIFYFQLLHPGPNGSLQTGGGGLYGDTALHLAYTSRIQTGEFPPQNPLFAGKILVYPYANDLLSAVLRINGIAANFAFFLPQILFLIAFLTLFYTFCRKFTSDRGFLFSLLLFSFGWGVGFAYFLSDLSKNIGGLQVDYTNNPQFNLHFHNVFTGLVLPERSFLPGLFIGLWIFMNFWEYFRTKSKSFLIINSILLGILPFWHVHTFIFVLISSAVFVVYSLSQNFRENIRQFLILPIISFVIALPFLILLLTNHITESFLRFSAGWENQGENIVFFWLKNSFLILPLAAIGFWKLKNDSKILFAAPFVAFFLANFVIFQPWSWDNIKLLTFSFLFFVILAGFFLNYLFEKNIILKALVIVIVFVSCLSGLLSILLQLKQTFVIYDKSDIELANWAKNNTKINEVFLIDPTPNHPLPGLAGRLVYVGYPGHLWVHGVNYSEREALTREVVAGNFNLIAEAQVPVSYIVLPKSNLVPTNSTFAVAFENSKYIVLDAY